MSTTMPARESTRTIELADVRLEADLAVPAGVPSRGLVVFVHGSGSSRRSGRNRAVAASLQSRGFATLLFDLLSTGEDRDATQRFDIPKLTGRLLEVTRWIGQQTELSGLPLAYFGASTGAAAALGAAAMMGEGVAAVVSRGGRPDLAMDSLPRVRAPTLLIVGGADAPVLAMNREAYARLECTRRMAIVPGATHLFEEPGALVEVATLAGEWLERHCHAASSSGAHC